MYGNYSAKELAEILIKQTEENLAGQLSELVDRGILVSEHTQVFLTEDWDPATGMRKIKLSQGVRLIPKEKEYITKLEQENKLLKVKLQTEETHKENLRRYLKEEG